MLGVLISTGELFGALAAVLGTAMVHPRSRKVAYVITRFGKRHMPPWALATVAVCALIPGPLDEMLVFPVLVLVTLRTARKRAILRRYLRVALR